MTRIVLYVGLGFAAGWAFANREKLLAIWTNKENISSAGKVAGGAQDVFEGAKDLWGRIFK